MHFPASLVFGDHDLSCDMRGKPLQQVMGAHPVLYLLGRHPGASVQELLFYSDASGRTAPEECLPHVRNTLRSLAVPDCGRHGPGEVIQMGRSLSNVRAGTPMLRVAGIYQSHQNCCRHRGFVAPVWGGDVIHSFDNAAITLGDYPAATHGSRGAWRRC